VAGDAGGPRAKDEHDDVQADAEVGDGLKSTPISWHGTDQDQRGTDPMATSVFQESGSAEDLCFEVVECPVA
jgi:hypothetical protein